jgi:hypothetical protein
MFIGAQAIKNKADAKKITADNNINENYPDRATEVLGNAENEPIFGDAIYA